MSDNTALPVLISRLACNETGMQPLHVLLLMETTKVRILVLVLQRRYTEVIDLSVYDKDWSRASGCLVSGHRIRIRLGFPVWWKPARFRCVGEMPLMNE